VQGKHYRMKESGMDQRKGLLFVVSAPSGAGKTTLCQEVTKKVPNLEHSISYTTREPRPGEVHGKDYFYVDHDEFQKMIENNEFLEWAEVHGRLYGTPREFLATITSQGADVILDIDSQGALQLKKKKVADAVYIYILPPSFEALKARLMERKSESDEEISNRLKKAREEIWSYREYYYLIVNDDIKRAGKELQAIILAERIKMKRMNLGWIEETFIKPKFGERPDSSS
jgi:guanylate kinase